MQMHTRHGGWVLTRSMKSDTALETERSRRDVPVRGEGEDLGCPEIHWNEACDLMVTNGSAKGKVRKGRHLLLDLLVSDTEFECQQGEGKKALMDLGLGDSRKLTYCNLLEYCTRVPEFYHCSCYKQAQPPLNLYRRLSISMVESSH